MPDAPPNMFAIVKAQVAWIVLAIVAMFMWVLSLVAMAVITYQIAQIMERIRVIEDSVFISGRCLGGG